MKERERETDDQKRYRLLKRKAYKKKRNESETLEQKRLRLDKIKEYKRKRNLVEGSEQKAKRYRLDKRDKEIGLQRRRNKLKRRNKREVGVNMSHERKRHKKYSGNLCKSMSHLVSLFHKVVAEGPTHICICCDQLWYRHSVQCARVLSELKNSACKQCICVKSNCELANKWICRTCLANLRKNKIPRCATVNKMGFPYKPKNLNLTELEWRLVSPRLVFEKLHEAPRGKQMKICGNIVNVPANVVNTVSVLPRLSKEAGIIKVQLKRKLKYKSYTLSQNVRPRKVFEAAKWLIENGSLFKQEKITLNKNWMKIEEAVTSDRSGCVALSGNYHDIMLCDSPSTNKQVSEIYVCLDCDQCLNDFDNLDSHMVIEHRASYRFDNDCSYSYRYNIMSQCDDDSGLDEIFFCSICSCFEVEEKPMTEHMTIAHDIPSEEMLRGNFNVDENVIVKICIHKILKPSSVFLVEVYKKGYIPSSSLGVKVYVAVPHVIYVHGLSNSEVVTDEEVKPVEDNCMNAEENDCSWDEIDESEETVGALDTMLIPPHFIENNECEESVFCFAPAEGNKPISIFKDKYCEELAYPGIFCGEARADNKERLVYCILQ